MQSDEKCGGRFLTGQGGRVFLLDMCMHMCMCTHKCVCARLLVVTESYTKQKGSAQSTLRVSQSLHTRLRLYPAALIPCRGGDIIGQARLV